jgi:hypothetical protein
VGGRDHLVKHLGYSSPLTVHWDGSTWTNVPDPLPLNPGTALVGVADISPANAYVIATKARLTGWSSSKTAPRGRGPRPSRRSLSPTGARSPGTHSMRSPPLRRATCGSSGPTCKPSTANIWDPYSVHWDGAAWNLVTMPQVTGAVFIG